MAADTPKLPALEHELKYVLPVSLVPGVLGFLRSVCRLDPRHPDNSVVSMYYDNLQLEALAEKVDSHHSKKKIRVRWYEDSSSGRKSRHCYLEVKARLGSQREKHRQMLEASPQRIESLSMEHSELRALPLQLPPAVDSARVGLFPVLVLGYRRRRFVDRQSQTRIALDTNITLRKVNTRFLSHVRPLPPRMAVLEIKNLDGRLPKSLDRLLEFGCRLRSFSKYAVCYASGELADASWV